MHTYIDACSFTKKHDEGASPIIAVILIFFLSIFLLGIFSSVLFGTLSGADITPQKKIGITCIGGNKKIDVTFYTGKDVADIRSLQINNAQGGSRLGFDNSGDYQIGKMVVFKKILPSMYEINIAATFNDGSRSVIYSGTIIVT